MLIENDKNGKKKQKYFVKMHKPDRRHNKGRFLRIGIGMVLTAISVFLLALGYQFAVSYAAEVEAPYSIPAMVGDSAEIESGETIFLQSKEATIYYLQYRNGDNPSGEIQGKDIYDIVSETKATEALEYKEDTGITPEAVSGDTFYVYAVAVKGRQMSEVSNFKYKITGMKDITLETNIKETLTVDAGKLKVSKNTRVYIKDYKEKLGNEVKRVEAYYKLYDVDPKLDEVSADLANVGTKYDHTKGIVLTGNVPRYLYIQQQKIAENDQGVEQVEEKKLMSLEVSFFDDYKAEITSTPATDNTNITTLMVGNELEFYSEGTEIYYTVDGTRPSFVRAEYGEKNNKDIIVVNKEGFLPESDSMKKYDSRTKIVVPYEWLAEGSKTLYAITYKKDQGISEVFRFRFKIKHEQVLKPTINPETSAANPVTLANGTQVALSTQTVGGIILYTLDGKGLPSYTIEKVSGGYQLKLAEGTYRFNGKVEIRGRAGEKVSVTAMTILPDLTTGTPKKLDSDPALFIYQIEASDVAEPPTATPEDNTQVALNSKVYLSTTTSGGAILYTTDGSTPSYEIKEVDGSYQLVLNGTTKQYGKENSFITVSEPDARQGGTFLVLAKTICVNTSNGEKLLEDSNVVKFSYPVTDADKVEPPTAVPATTQAEPATVKEGEKILLTCATTGAEMYYTLDGSAPIVNEDGTLAGTTVHYANAAGIKVPEGNGYLTVTVMAVMDGMRNSDVVQFVYKYPEAVSPPYATPVEGLVSMNTAVTLASLNENAQIYYTLDGSEPTAVNGRMYSEPIVLQMNTIIKAICVVDGVSSISRTFTYTVAPGLTAPTPSIASGTVVTSGTIVKLTAQKGAVIYYTTDGTSPKEGSPMSGTNVSITGKPGEAVTVLAYAKGTNFSDSPMATFVYMISNYENGVKVSPEPGSKVKSGDVISLDTDVTNGVIYYTTDGNSPASGIRGSKVLVSDPKGEEKLTLKVMVVPEGAEFTSSIATFVYEYMEMPIAPKSSIPNGAVLLKNQQIELTADIGNIYYTVDNSEPDDKSDLYTEPIEVTEAMTIKAIAISEEGASSEIAEFAYTFAEKVAPPVFSLKGGEVEAGTSLTISSATEGASIYYTMDGQVPDLKNTKNLFLYAGAIALNKPVNIKAIAVKDRMTESDMSSVIYTVKEPEVVIPEEETEDTAGKGTGGRLQSRRSYMNSNTGPTYTDMILRSAGTGVIVSAETDVIPAEAEITVMETAVDPAVNHAVENSAGSEFGAVACYEVSLVLNDEAIQPSGEVEIGLPIPEEYRNSTIAIAYIDEEGNANLHETRRDGTTAYAFVNHFSRYCVVAPVNLTPKAAGFNWKILLVAAGVLLVAGYLLIRKGRKKNMEDEVTILD